MTFLVLLGTFSVVYIITANRLHAGFYDQLWERAVLVAQINFGQYELSDQIYYHLLNSYQFALPEEESHIFNADAPQLVDSLKTVVPGGRFLNDILHGKTIHFEFAGRQHVAIYYPGEVSHIIVVSGYDKQGADNMRNLLELLLIILFSSTLFVFLIGRLYARRVMEPVRRIIDNVKSITASNLKRSLHEERGNDELSELSRTFNQMIERLRMAFDMQNSFIRNASHELRNPLAAILGETELALNRPRSAEEYVQTLHTVLEETERLSYMTQDLLMLAQTDFDFSRIRKGKTDLPQLLSGIGEELRRNYPETRVEVYPEALDKYEVMAAVSILRLALLNLIGNAVKFSDGKPVIVRLSETRLGHIHVEIIDRGIGIPPGDFRHIFQPFYRGTNASGYKGTGIGLALAKRIIELHEGRLTMESKVGEGTKAIVRLKSCL